MGKEVKIGLGVIGVLLCIFGGVLAMRLKREHPANAQEKVAAAEKEGKLPKGKKKSTEKAGKEGKDKDGPSFGGLNSLSSRSRRNKPETNDKAKTDRYGRPLDDEPAAELSQLPDRHDGNSFNDNETEQQQTEVPDPRLSPYGGGGDRYGRYKTNDAEAEDGQDGATDSPTDEATGAELSMPVDRFPQGAEGVSFSEVTDDTNETEKPSSDEPRFSLGGTVERTAANEEAVEQEGAADEQTNQDDADRRFESVARDDDMRQPANNRFRDRLNEERSLRDSSPAANDLVDETDPRGQQPFDEKPRQLEPDGDTYTVEPNDNFWRISQKVYGTGAYFKALEAHNRQQFGDRPLINVGDAISVPPVAELQQKYPDLSPKPRKLPTERRNTSLVSSPARGGRTYTVAEGDTLFDIARQELGKASRWSEIYDLNRDQLGEDFNYLSPGTQLAMPARDDADPVATRPRDRALAAPSGTSRGTYRR